MWIRINDTMYNSDHIRAMFIDRETKDGIEYGGLYFIMGDQSKAVCVYIICLDEPSNFNFLKGLYDKIYQWLGEGRTVFDVKAYEHVFGGAYGQQGKEC